MIGELQSDWGVPQSPQEYRITIKVAEEREERGQRTATVEETLEDPPDDHSVEPGGPRRERAPAAPRIGGNVARIVGTSKPEEGDDPSEESSEAKPKRRRRRGRGGRGRRGGGGR